MKTIIVFLFLGLVATSSFAQTIRRVNNNPGVTGTNIYATLQAAHDAASDNDIVYVEISDAVYPAVTLTKPLTIIGPGSMSDVYNDENGQATEGNTRIDAITLETGSSGTKLISLDVEGSITNNEAANITIERCEMNRLYLATLNTEAHTSVILVHGCMVWDGIFQSGGVNSGSWTYSSISIQNSVIGTLDLDLSNRYFGIIQNNIFWNNYFRVRNFSITNNIRTSSANSGYFELGASTTSNNVGSGSVFPAINGNQNNVTMTDVFVFSPYIGLSGNYTEETRWVLSETSPAKGAGVSGVDCGIFGGPSPYVLGGIAPYPAIHKMSSTGTGSQTSPLTVTISTKSNN